MEGTTQRERVAVIGAGMAGLTCARALTEAGIDVAVFDKARGPGGRMASRRQDGAAFDHGAQFFTAREPEFVRAVSGWRERGLVSRWSPRVALVRDGGAPTALVDGRTRFVGAPRMSALTRALASGLDLRVGRRVRRLARGAGGRWRLETEGGALDGSFAAVVVAIPATQARALVSSSRALREPLASVTFDPCIAAMVTFDEPVDTQFDALRYEGSRRVLAWAARDSSKAKRAPGERWVLHSSPQWARRHIDDDPETSARALARAFGAGFERAPVASVVIGHRWRYARVRRPLGRVCLFDATARVGVCGDWCVGPRVESAYRSGLAVARRVVGSLSLGVRDVFADARAS